MAKPKVQEIRKKVTTARIQKLREKIAARKTERQDEETKKYAKMRLVAAKAPEKLEKCLAGLAEKCASMAEGWENLRENLGLVKAPREAALKQRVATARVYGKKFVRVAEEAPNKLVDALSEAYQRVNEIAAVLENAAQQMGISLELAAPEELGFSENGLEDEAQHAVIEEADRDNESPQQEHIEEHEEELAGGEEEEDKEASGSDAWITDRGNDGPEAPVLANSDGFVNDRNKGGEPQKPSKLDIPQAQGKAVKAKKASVR